MLKICNWSMFGNSNLIKFMMDSKNIRILFKQLQVSVIMKKERSQSMQGGYSPYMNFYYMYIYIKSFIIIRKQDTDAPTTIIIL